jgi:hypothetical protein
MRASNVSFNQSERRHLFRDVHLAERFLIKEQTDASDLQNRTQPLQRARSRFLVPTLSTNNPGLSRGIYPNK